MAHPHLFSDLIAQHVVDKKSEHHESCNIDQVNVLSHVDVGVILVEEKRDTEYEDIY